MINSLIGWNQSKIKGWIGGAVILLLVALSYMVSEGSTDSVQSPNGESYFQFTPPPAAGSIVVVKQTIPDGDLTGFEFVGDVTAKLADGEMAAVTVDPGTYSSVELVPPQWKLEEITCVDTQGDSFGRPQTATAIFVVASDETVTCTFTNRFVGELNYLPVIQNQ